jgi:hypothetical protein
MTVKTHSDDAKPLRGIDTGLSGFGDEELLAELLRRNPPKPGPVNTSRSAWPESIIGIGRDESCYITLHPNALAAMGRWLN